MRPSPLSTNELHICHRCRRGWEHFGVEQPNCDSCGKPRAVWYRHGIDAPPNEYYAERDSLLRYLGKDPNMNPEPMEELDFSPLQAVIDNQEMVIEELKERIEELENHLKGMTLDRDNRDEALEEIGKLVSQYV